MDTKIKQLQENDKKLEEYFAKITGKSINVNINYEDSSSSIPIDFGNRIDWQTINKVFLTAIEDFIQKEIDEKTLCHIGNRLDMISSINLKHITPPNSDLISILLMAGELNELEDLNLTPTEINESNKDTINEIIEYYKKYKT